MSVFERVNNNNFVRRKVKLYLRHLLVKIYIQLPYNLFFVDKVNFLRSMYSFQNKSM